MMLDRIRNNWTLENCLCLYVILCPILDIVSFLFRNYFKTSFSPSTFIRPIIPCVLFIILFFKEKNKKQKIGIAFIYFMYSVIHLSIFQKLHNESSYGTWKNEIQYIANYSLMIINLYLFYVLIKDREKIQKSVFISLAIYVASLILSIITKTSSSTYLEGIGYKGYFESGNSLCTVLILSVCILLSNIDKKEWQKIILIIFTGIYLIVFSGMRTGLFGFCAVVVIFVLGKFFIAIRDNVHLSKKQIMAITVGIVLAIVLTFILGAKTLERRKFLKQNEMNNIDEQTNSQRYVSGDVLNLYKQIEKGTLPEDYMSDSEKKAIVDLNQYAQKIKLSNVNLRAQQFLYNIFLIKHQKSTILILFGNGYKNQIGELVMEMEILSVFCNFGLFGLILYFGPVIAIASYGIYNGFRNRKRIDIQSIMYLTGSGLAISLSTLSGYVYFNFSSMTMAIILNVFLIQEKCTKRTGSQKSILKNVPK